MSYEYTPAMGELDRNSMAYRELYGRTGNVRSSIRRASGRSCPNVEGGKQYVQKDWHDRELYTQAGCVHIGPQTTRSGIVISEHQTPALMTTYQDIWCCNRDSVEQVFTEWTQSPEYEGRQKAVGVILGAFVLGTGYLVWRGYKKRVEAGEDLDFISKKTTILSGGM